MAHLPYADPDRPDLRPLVDRIVAERGEVLHLYRMLLHSPPLAEGWLGYFTQVRQRLDLDAGLRELVIMEVAHLNRAPYEAEQHVPFALRAGLTQAQLDALPHWQASPDFDARQRAALQLADTMTSHVQVPAALMAEVRAQLDDRQTVELVATIAGYNMVSRFLEALQIHSDDSTTPELMTTDSPIRRVAVVGAGAVGGYFGAMLARAGHAVTLIGRPAHVEAIGRARPAARQGRARRVDPGGGEQRHRRGPRRRPRPLLREVDRHRGRRRADRAAPRRRRAGAEPAERRRECRAIARRVAPTVVPAVVYVATAMPAPGIGEALRPRRPRHRPARRRGGRAIPRSARASQELAAFFAAAGVPVQVSANVMAELWSKLLVNCAYNAISGPGPGAATARSPRRPRSASCNARWSPRSSPSPPAEGIDLPLAPALEAMTRIAAAMPAQLSSTAQDMAKGKPSEIEHLNGFVARRGRALGIATPANQALYALVKLVEAAQADGKAASA